MNKLIRKILEYLRVEPQHLEKLLKRGLKVGKNFNRMGGVIIDPSHCYHITIGDNVTLAPRVHILAHDASTFIFFGKTRAANVTIGNNVFVGYGTVILPDTYIGDNVIIGAGSIVRGKVDSDSVVVGNPAKRVCSYFEYIDKNRKLLEEGYICENGITPEVIALMDEKRVFVE